MLFQDQTGKLWEVVGEASRPDSESVIVLRDQAGAQLAVDRSQFPPESDAKYTLIGPTVSRDAVDATKELLQSIRHQTTIRFVALPVFLATMGGLAGAWVEGKVAAAGAAELLGITGMGLAVVFAIYDIVLSSNLIAVWRVVKRQQLTPPWRFVFAHRRDNDITNYWLWIVRVSLYLPYAAGAAFWASALTGPSHWKPMVLFGLLLTLAMWTWFLAHKE